VGLDIYCLSLLVLCRACLCPDCSMALCCRYYARRGVPVLERRNGHRTIPALDVSHATFEN